MKAFASILVLAVCALAGAQNPSNADAMKSIGFLAGKWTGVQKFNTGGAPMEAKVLNDTRVAVSGKFLEESLAVDLNGKKSDTVHLTTYDAKAGLYRAWWFNDTRSQATEFSGKLEGDKLVLTSNAFPGPGGQEVTLRVTYAKTADGFAYGLEMKRGEEWTALFETRYVKAS